MEVLTFVCGPYRTNNYLYINGKDAILLDATQDRFNKVDTYIKNNGINLKAVLLTHGHFDHLDGVKKYKDAGIPVYIHKNDALMTNANSNLSNLFGFNSFESFDADVLIEENGRLDIDGFDLEVINTPGHSLGSVCYIDRQNKIIFSGDTLFYKEVGRCDLPGGDFDAIKKSIKKLYALPGDFRVLPGHDRETTLDFERKNNPYVKL